MSADCIDTKRTQLRRHPERGLAGRGALDAILDQALVCHVGFVDDGHPVVIPTIHARGGDTLYLHGSPASRMLRSLAGGIQVCVTVTLVDGIVLAKSWFHHSLNYRSAVIFGTAHPVTDAEEKLAALRAIVEHVQAGRTEESRAPSRQELTGTLVLALPLDEWSVKARTGGPIEAEEDEALTWTNGVVPVPPGRLGAA